MKFLRVTTFLLAAFLLSSIASANEQAEFKSWLKQIVDQHPRLQSAQAATEKAIAEIRAADQPLFNPEIEFEYDSTDVDTKTAGITQTIDWGDKRSAQTRIARFKLQRSLSELTLQRQILSAETLLTLARYQSNVERRNIANKRVQSMNQFADIAKQRYAAEDITEIDLVLAQLAQSEASFRLTDATAELINSEQSMHVLLGEESANSLEKLPVMMSLPNSPDYPVKNKEALLDNLPQMKLARARMDIARAEISLRQRKQSPNPTIGIRAGKEGNESLANITFSMPLFVRNNFSAEVEAANAELIQRQREAIDTRRVLDAQLTTAAKTLQINRQTWLQWQTTGNKSLVKQVELLELFWRVGELSTTDYLVQLKQSLDTQASATEQRTQLWLSWTQWLIASGEINQWTTSNDVVIGDNATQSDNGE